MPRLSTISLFLEVVRSGSFSEAARKLGTAPSSVSRLIGSLEAELETQLFYRNTRRLTLTDAGQHYFDRLAPLLSEIEGVHQEMSEFDCEPRGIMRLTAPTEFARIQLAPMLKKYFKDCPNVRIELIVQDGYVDLVEEGIDLAIRFGRLRDTSLIARKLVDDPAILCGSETYFSEFGMPEYPADLTMHNCLQFEPPGDARRPSAKSSLWRFRYRRENFEVAVEGSIIANSVAPLVTAALDGLGIVIAPRWSVKEHIDRGDLIPILSKYKVEWGAEDRAIYVVYPPTHYLPLKVRSFVDFIARELRSRAS